MMNAFERLSNKPTSSPPGNSSETIEQRTAAPATKPLTRGGLARDKGGRVGEVMELGERRVHLRPPGGGREWESPVTEVTPVTTGDVLLERVRDENAARAREPR